MFLLQRSWSIRIYPGGFNEECKDYLSCFVSLESRGTCRASFKITLLNQKGWKNIDFSSEVITFSKLDAINDRSAFGNAKFIYKNDLKYETNGFCVNDKIVIKVDLVIYGDIEHYIHAISSSASSNSTSLKKTRTLTDSLSSLLHDNSTTDVVIQVDNETIQAHKFMLCLRSDVFKAMFDSQMSEGLSNEIIITDFDGNTIKELLSFIYTDNCSPKALESHGETLLAAACKYQIKGLELLCENFLSSTLNVNNVANILYLSNLYDSSHLKSRALQFISHNAKSVIQSEGFFDKLGFGLCQEVIKALAGVDDCCHDKDYHSGTHCSDEHKISINTDRI